MILSSARSGSIPGCPGRSKPVTVGTSLQLFDTRQDNWRAGNWSAARSVPAAPQWVYVSTTGSATSSKFYIYLESAGDVYIDDLSLCRRLIARGRPQSRCQRQL